MSIQGNLRDMGLVDLIQHNCQDQKTARLNVQKNGVQAEIYFHDGNVIHAVLGDQTGEEVIYRILEWEDGQFILESEVVSNTTTINRSWSSLLLEGARRLDENSQKPSINKEHQTMTTKKRSELLSEALTRLLEDSSDIEGAAVVGWDGLLYSANVPNRSLDEDLVGAASAAVLGLSLRSVDQLKRGKFRQTMIQGDDGNIIVADLGNSALFVGLTQKNVNLGMVFAEVRSMIGQLNEIM